MAEKGSKTAVVNGKPMQMKLFATWEVDRTPSNCIPRLCSLTLTRLVVVRPLGADLASITVAVKMRSSKRILRSNEMALPSSGHLDTELDLHFALQYPHFLKRDGNQLHVMLQRRKRYKNRTILGFKTLAEGVINMSQVLQRPMEEREVDLLSESKDGKPGGVTARVMVSTLTSQPVDQKPMTADLADRFSDEDEDFNSSPDDDAEGSDSEPMLDEAGRRLRKPRGKIPANARQRNLKQKFISLLKRFRQNEGLAGLGPDPEGMGRKLSGGDMDPTEIEDLFEELDDLSESGPEMDTLSISSTPKPSLRPFFSSSRSLVPDSLCTPGVIAECSEPEPVDKPTERKEDRLSDESSKGRPDSEAGTDLDASDPPPSRGSRLFLRDKPLGKPKKSLSEPKALTTPVLPLDNSTEPRKVLLEQVARVMTPEDSLPDHVILASAAEPQGSLLAVRLQERQLKVLPILTAADLRPVFTSLVNRIQKLCHTIAKPCVAVKVLAIGNDAFFNSMLRQYVEQLSQKPTDLHNYIRFYIVPLGVSQLARYLSRVDSTYAANFACDAWRELADARADGADAATRVTRYLHNASATVLLPIAEAMLTYKEKSSDDESCQVFVPFLCDVRIGAAELCATSASVELDDTPVIGGSPPRITPPSSPNVNAAAQPRELIIAEPLDLQLDYWTVGKQTEAKEKGKDPNKSSVKTTFKGLLIQRIPVNGEQPGSYFNVNYSTKEKKQKIMRLGKKKEKERETECKSQRQVDSVSRLICSTRTHTLPLKVSIDGVEWNAVKFFQLSAQWQTHIKTLPIALFSNDGS